MPDRIQPPWRVRSVVLVGISTSRKIFRMLVMKGYPVLHIQEKQMPVLIALSWVVMSAGMRTILTNPIDGLITLVSYIVSRRHMRIIKTTGT